VPKKAGAWSSDLVSVTGVWTIASGNFVAHKLGRYVLWNCSAERLSRVLLEK